MSTHNYKVLKNYPVQYIVKNPRHWWQTINTTYSEDTTVDVELRPFEGLEYTVNKPLITFSRQTLLDGTILDERTYALIESGQEYEYREVNNNASIIGTLTEADGVYSGFADNTNYLLISKTYKPNQSNAEFFAKFTTGSDVTAGGAIIDGNLMMSMTVAESTVGYWNWSGSRRYSHTITIQPNTTYWVKASITGNVVKSTISTDGVTFSDEITFTDSNINFSAAYDVCIGASSWDFTNAFTGFIDLKETYMKSDGEIVWSYYNTKYYYGCLEDEAKIYEYDYTALVKDGEVLLVDYDQLRTGYTWANTVTIPGDDYFAPVEPFE